MKSGLPMWRDARRGDERCRGLIGVKHLARSLSVPFLPRVRPFRSETVVFSDTVACTCAEARVVAVFRRVGCRHAWRYDEQESRDSPNDDE